MVVSTSKYLEQKKALQENIDWYVKNIPILEEQNNQRKLKLKDFQDRLYNLEKEYYTNG